MSEEEQDWGGISDDYDYESYPKKIIGKRIAGVRWFSDLKLSQNKIGQTIITYEWDNGCLEILLED